VVPPSHVAEDEREGTYKWLSRLETTPLAPMPAWLLEQVKDQKASKKGNERAAKPRTRSIRAMADEGRNSALTSLAGTMRKRDASTEAVRQALLAENAAFPRPLPVDEVETIVGSAERNFVAGDDHDVRNTEQFYAEQLALTASDCVRYNDEIGKWFVYDGTRWAMTTHNTVVPFITDMAKSLYLRATSEPDPDKRRRYATQGARLESARIVRSIIEMAKALPQLRVRADEFDQDEHLLNVENGIVDLKTVELLPHDAKYMMSRLAPVAYDPDAVCPLWNSTVTLAMQGDIEKEAFLQRAFGYALTGYTSEDKFFNLVGKSGANGKTTLLTALSVLLGDYATTLRVEALLAGTERLIPHDLADLRGARLVVTSETPSGKKFDDRLLKMLSGDDEVTACYKFGNNFRFFPQFKLFMYSNHPLRLSLVLIAAAIVEFFDISGVAATCRAAHRFVDCGARRHAQRRRQVRCDEERRPRRGGGRWPDRRQRSQRHPSKAR
jgi:putative DNA primase/helicase